MTEISIDALAATECEVLRVCVGGHVVAVPAIAVREILEPLPVTPLPGALAAVEGLVDVHGEALAAVDLRSRLATAAPPTSQLLLVRDDATGRATCVRVDRVMELWHLALGHVLPPPAVAGGIARYVLGVLPGGVPLLDLTEILEESDRVRLDEMLAALAEDAPPPGDPSGA
ncbi:MAG: chemotaxis protein CheW [Acidobacteriota bacterium]